MKRRKDGRSGFVFSQKGMYLFASVLSAAIYGMEVREIQVEADVSDGLPSFAMVGFPSAQVREAQERVRTAFKNNRLCLPPKKVTVNFAPADRKELVLICLWRLQYLRLPEFWSRIFWKEL